MLNFIGRRLLGLIPLFFGITLISFAIIHLAPGSPVAMQTALNPKMAQARERLEKLYGLDKPLHVQYIAWLGRFAKADFGESFMDGQPVTKRILERLPVTLTINITSLVIIFLGAMGLGVLAAVNEGRLTDHALTAVFFLLFALPGFWLALLAMTFFGIHLGWLPISGLASIEFDRMSRWAQVLDVAHHLLLPVAILSFVSMMALARYMRAQMIGVLHQDYIRTARAKGLPERRVLFGHAMKNAMLPIITILGLSLPDLIGGSVIIESIFAIPGMGRLFYDAVMSRDYPIIMGMLVVGAILTLLGNLLADVMYAYADPRIRIGGQQA